MSPYAVWDVLKITRAERKAATVEAFHEYLIGHVKPKHGCFACLVSALLSVQTQDTTAMRVRKAEQLLRAHHGKARHASHVQRSRRARAAPAHAYSVDGSGDIDSMSFRQRMHVQAGAKARQHRTLHHRHLAPSRKRAHGHANKNPDTPSRPPKHIAAWTADVDARAIFKRDKDLLAHPWQAHVQA